jgi:hypothetical protein
LRCHRALSIDDKWQYVAPQRQVPSFVYRDGDAILPNWQHPLWESYSFGQWLDLDTVHTDNTDSWHGATDKPIAQPLSLKIPWNTGDDKYTWWHGIAKGLGGEVDFDKECVGKAVSKLAGQFRGDDPWWLF